MNSMYYHSGIIPLWNLSTRRVIPLETSLKDPSFLCWSKTSGHLAIGTAKGNLLIYNKMKKQKIPVVGTEKEHWHFSHFRLSFNQPVPIMSFVIALFYL